MSEDRKKILEMLSEGKINVEEAEKLLAALSQGSSGSTNVSADARPLDKSKLKYLRVLVEPGPNSDNNEKVNIRIPLNLIRAGLKWAAFVPKNVQVKVDEALHDQGINIDLGKIKPEDIVPILVELAPTCTWSWAGLLWMLGTTKPRSCFFKH